MTGKPHGKPRPTKTPKPGYPTQKPYEKPVYTLPHMYTTPKPGQKPNRPKPNPAYAGDILDIDISQYLNNPDFAPWKPSKPWKPAGPGNYGAKPVVYSTLPPATRPNVYAATGNYNTGTIDYNPDYKPVYPVKPSYKPPNPYNNDLLYTTKKPYEPAIPTYTDKPTYTNKPSYTPKPVYTTKPDYSQKPVYPTKPVYPAKPVYTQKPVYTPEPVYPTKPVYTQKPVYTEKPVYPEKPIYPENPVYPGKPITAKPLQVKPTYGPLPDDYKTKYSPHTIQQQEMISEFSAGHDLEGIFKAEEIDVVYITSPNGYKFRVEFNFEWQMLSKPGDNDTYTDDSYLDEYGIPLDDDALCLPKHLLIPGNRVFSLDGKHAKDEEMALKIFNMIIKSIANFQEFFGQYESHCEPTIHRLGLKKFRNFILKLS